MTGIPGRTLTRHVKRKAALVSILVRHGFGHLLAELGWGGKTGPETVRPEMSQIRATNLRDALTDAGVTFIKLGQKLACRPDLLPPDYIRILGTLQEDVPPPEWADMRAVLKAELGSPPKDLFARFETRPTAAASIGVVYRAELPDGRPVAVKVQRPGIEAEVRADLAILADLADALEKRIPASRRYQPKALVRQFAESLRDELDFLGEAAKIEQFADVLADHQGIFIPGAIREWCTSRVLTMDWVDGAAPGSAADFVGQGIDLSKTAHNLSMSLLRQTLESGCFHGDPHQGNVRIMADGRAAFLDFGNVSYIGRQSRRHFERLLGAFFLERADLVSTVLVNAGVLGPGVDIRAFQHDADLLLAKSMRSLDNRRNLELLFREFLVLVNRYEVANFPTEWVALMLSFGLMEGVCRMLDENFDMFAAGREMTERHVSPQIDEPRRWLAERILGLREFQDLVTALPGRVERLLTKLEAGDLKIRHEHERSESFMTPLSKGLSRLTAALITAGLLTSGALLLGRTESALSLGLGYVLLAAGGLGTAGILWGLWRGRRKRD
jgi:ubiquinone biosynthesis protein